MLKKLGIALSLVLAVAIAYVCRTLLLSPVHLDPVDLSGRVAVVTGGTSGIGLETVKKLVEWNATVIAPARSKRRGEAMQREVARHLAALHGQSSGTVETVEMDLASFSSVRKFASAVLNKDTHVDMLILNAGMMTGDELNLSEDGIEMVYQVNHLSHFLLTRLLLPALAHTEGRPARIVHVSSSLHFNGHLDHEAYSDSSRNTQADTRRLSFKSYSDTKLMNVVFSNRLDRLFKQDGSEKYSAVTSVSIHPGFVMTELDRGLPPLLETLMVYVRSLIARPTADGAVTQVAAATHPEVLKHGGGLYFEDQCIMTQCTACILCSIDPARKVGVIPHIAASSEEEQDWLWVTSSNIVGLPPNFTTES